MSAKRRDPDWRCRAALFVIAPRRADSRPASLERHQQRPLLHRSARRDLDAAHLARRRRAQLVLHFHCFHHDNPLPSLDHVANGNVHADYEPGHRGDNGSGAGGAGIGNREISQSAPPLIQRFDIEPVTIDPQKVPASAVAFLFYDTEDLGSDANHHHRTAFDVGELRRNRRFGLVSDLIAIERYGVSLAIYLDNVLHAALAAGRSTHTVSTWAVCGNMSKPCTASIW